MSQHQHSDIKRQRIGSDTDLQQHNDTDALLAHNQSGSHLPENNASLHLSSHSSNSTLPIDSTDSNLIPSDKNNASSANHISNHDLLGLHSISNNPVNQSNHLHTDSFQHDSTQSYFNSSIFSDYQQAPFAQNNQHDQNKQNDQNQLNKHVVDLAQTHGVKRKAPIDIEIDLTSVASFFLNPSTSANTNTTSPSTSLIPPSSTTSTNTINKKVNLALSTPLAPSETPKLPINSKLHTIHTISSSASSNSSSSSQSDENDTDTSSDSDSDDSDVESDTESTQKASKSSLLAKVTKTGFIPTNKALKTPTKPIESPSNVPTSQVVIIINKKFAKKGLNRTGDPTDDKTVKELGFIRAVERKIHTSKSSHIDLSKDVYPVRSTTSKPNGIKTLPKPHLIPRLSSNMTSSLLISPPVRSASLSTLQMDQTNMMGRVTIFGTSFPIYALKPNTLSTPSTTPLPFNLPDIVLQYHNTTADNIVLKPTAIGTHVKLDAVRINSITLIFKTFYRLGKQIDSKIEVPYDPNLTSAQNIALKTIKGEEMASLDTGENANTVEENDNLLPTMHVSAPASNNMNGNIDTFTSNNLTNSSAFRADYTAIVEYVYALSVLLASAIEHQFYKQNNDQINDTYRSTIRSFVATLGLPNQLPLIIKIFLGFYPPILVAEYAIQGSYHLQPEHIKLEKRNAENLVMFDKVKAQETAEELAQKKMVEALLTTSDGAVEMKVVGLQVDEKLKKADLQSSKLYPDMFKRVKSIESDNEKNTKSAKSAKSAKSGANRPKTSRTGASSSSSSSGSSDSSDSSGSSDSSDSGDESIKKSKNVMQSGHSSNFLPSSMTFSSSLSSNSTFSSALLDFPMGDDDENNSSSTNTSRASSLLDSSLSSAMFQDIDYNDDSNTHDHSQRFSPASPASTTSTPHKSKSHHATSSSKSPMSPPQDTDDGFDSKSRYLFQNAKIAESKATQYLISIPTFEQSPPNAPLSEKFIRNTITYHENLRFSYQNTPTMTNLFLYSPVTLPNASLLPRLFHPFKQLSIHGAMQEFELMKLLIEMFKQPDRKRGIATGLFTINKPIPSFDATSLHRPMPKDPFSQQSSPQVSKVLNFNGKDIHVDDLAPTSCFVSDFSVMRTEAQNSFNIATKLAKSEGKPLPQLPPCLSQGNLTIDRIYIIPINNSLLDIDFCTNVLGIVKPTDDVYTYTRGVYAPVFSEAEESLRIHHEAREKNLPLPQYPYNIYKSPNDLKQNPNGTLRIPHRFLESELLFDAGYKLGNNSIDLNFSSTQIPRQIIVEKSAHCYTKYNPLQIDTALAKYGPMNAIFSPTPVTSPPASIPNSFSSQSQSDKPFDIANQLDALINETISPQLPPSQKINHYPSGYTNISKASPLYINVPQYRIVTEPPVKKQQGYDSNTIAPIPWTSPHGNAPFSAKHCTVLNIRYWCIVQFRDEKAKFRPLPTTLHDNDVTDYFDRRAKRFSNLRANITQFRETQQIVETMCEKMSSNEHSENFSTQQLDRLFKEQDRARFAEFSNDLVIIGENSTSLLSHSNTPALSNNNVPNANITTMNQSGSNVPTSLSSSGLNLDLLNKLANGQNTPFPSQNPPYGSNMGQNGANMNNPMNNPINSQMVQNRPSGPGPNPGVYMGPTGQINGPHNSLSGPNAPMQHSQPNYSQYSGGPPPGFNQTPAPSGPPHVPPVANQYGYPTRPTGPPMSQQQPLHNNYGPPGPPGPPGPHLSQPPNAHPTTHPARQQYGVSQPPPTINQAGYPVASNYGRGGPNPPGYPTQSPIQSQAPQSTALNQYGYPTSTRPVAPVTNSYGYPTSSGPAVPPPGPNYNAPSGYNAPPSGYGPPPGYPSQGPPPGSYPGQYPPYGGR